MPKRVDVFVCPDGSVWTFEPVTPRAKRWFTERVQAEAWQWLGGKLAVEHRCARDIYHALESVEQFSLSLS